MPCFASAFFAISAISAWGPFSTPTLITSPRAAGVPVASYPRSTATAVTKRARRCLMASGSWREAGRPVPILRCAAPDGPVRAVSCTLSVMADTPSRTLSYRPCCAAAGRQDVWSGAEPDESCERADCWAALVWRHSAHRTPRREGPAWASAVMADILTYHPLYRIRLTPSLEASRHAAASRSRRRPHIAGAEARRRATIALPLQRRARRRQRPGSVRGPERGRAQARPRGRRRAGDPGRADGVPAGRHSPGHLCRPLR